MPNVIRKLRERGFIEALTSEDLEKFVEEPAAVYCGFDPTSDSLHLGNLVAIMGLAWFEKCGHRPIALIGGATGMIGDPSGKKSERQLLDEETIQKNLAGITKNLKQVLRDPVIVNNYDWFKEFSFIDFLRDVGKHFRLGPMLAKESVRARLESEEGMSFTEFSYQLLQGYDFLHLYDQMGVELQLGGSDQWGNITAGKDLVRKLRGTSVHGVTFPLLTTSTGAKFGKSEKGAIWLSPEKLSPYEFYQYLFRVSDDDVIKLLQMLTFLEMEEIAAIESSMKQPGYVPNTAQKRLAEEVTRIVHGEEGLRTAQRVTEGAKPGSETALSADVLESLAQDMPTVEIPKDAAEGKKLVELFVEAGLMKSKGDARRLIRNGGAYLNNRKIHDENAALDVEDLIDGRMILLGSGKKTKLLVRLA